MILELDCGNSLIKWRVVQARGERLVVEGAVDSAQALLQVLREQQALKLLWCRLVSVRTEQETGRLVVALMEAFAIEVACARPAVERAGVRNGYEDHERLGIDRWLAMLGAFRLAGGPCLVLDLGTAVTSDFVAADGAHLGGFICPGMPLMRNQLRTHTRRIRYDDVAAERALGKLLPGRETVEAVERGCMLMVRGFILTQLAQAREYWGDDFEVFLTGGDAVLVCDMLPEARWVPDLVFVGLAIACPLS